MKKKIKDIGLWKELLASWLKSIGYEKTKAEYWFNYGNRSYMYGFFYTRIRISAIGNMRWDDMDLDTGDVDPCNPSFDPHIFFTPLKEWMDNHE